MAMDREARGAEGFFIERNTRKSILTKAADILFPPDLYCVSCGAVIDRSCRYGFCDACIRRFGWVGARTCARCGKVLPKESIHLFCHDCLHIEHHFDRGFTCTSYGLYERMLINDYKEKGRTWLSRRIGEIMADRWLIETGLADGAADPDAPVVDLVLFVPSSPSKVKDRGFDQMQLIAEQFAGRTGLPLADDLLVKVREPGAMRSRSAVERRQAVHGVYQVRDPGWRLADARVLLLDDVYTTGSTVDACTAALKDVGASEVFVLTFASGGDYRPQGEGTVIE